MIQFEDSAVRRERLKQRAAAATTRASFPNSKSKKFDLSPDPKAIAEVLGSFGNLKFWVSVNGSPFKNFPAAECARLLVIRLHRPATGVELLLRGIAFHPTPSVAIRIAKELAIFRVDDPRDRQ